MIDQISRLVHESGQAKVIEVVYLEDRPNMPAIPEVMKRWLYVGVAGWTAVNPGKEQTAVCALADLKNTLTGVGFQFVETSSTEYWFVVNGRTRTDQELIDMDPCGGDDCQIHCQTVKIVKTRKEHKCHGMAGSESMHVMPPGTRARFDKALVEGQWGSYYICAECIEKYMASEGI